MKKKRLMITAVLAVMIALTGLAAALGIETDPGNITVYNDGSGTFIVRVNTTEVTDGLKSLTVTGTQINNDSTPFNITSLFTVLINGTEGSTTGNLSGQPPITYWNVTIVNDKGAPNADYTIEFNASFQFGSFVKHTGYLHTQRDFLTVPEFPAIAVPVAAVIGLVFVFSNRKRKGEKN